MVIVQQVMSAWPSNDEKIASHSNFKLSAPNWP